jgi:hypothetical protein
MTALVNGCCAALHQYLGERGADLALKFSLQIVEILLSRSMIENIYCEFAVDVP